jgi:hypothetical protein
MGLLFRLLKASPKIVHTLYELTVVATLWAYMFVGEINLEAFQRWLWGTPQAQQQGLQQQVLDHQVQELFAEFQRHMDEQYQVHVLARDFLTLPALPEEGF